MKCPLRCYDVAASCNDVECSEKCEFSCLGVCERQKRKCAKWCYSREDCGLTGGCQDCTFCYDKSDDAGSKGACPVAAFRDVTALKLPATDPYWHQWRHSGRPYKYQGSPLLFDSNNDGILDYFYSMHGHPVNQTASCGYCERMELGESVPYNFTLDGVSVTVPVVSDEHPAADSPAFVGTKNAYQYYRFRRASYRIIFEEEVRDLDPHGQNILDLDGDGFDDILIASGGGRGQPIKQAELQQNKDNFLFWGEGGVDEITGLNTTIFRGGRPAARKAGLHMRMARGRANYIWDANGDGLLDVFMTTDSRGDNLLTPGVLLINQGNRTWKQDSSFSEFTGAMILTDADGDGFANEMIVSRGFCFPQRQQLGSTVKVNGPKLNENTREALGPFPSEVIDFCKTRPVGSTAVYRYDSSLGRMKEISIPYSNTKPDDSMQPPCCPHGTWGQANDCSAKGFASGDLDGDLKADLVVLYGSKFFIYLSSGRPLGALPVDPGFRSVEISLPDTCAGKNIFVTDLDNDGNPEIFVACDFGPLFLIYTSTQNTGRDDTGGSRWTLENDCNEGGAKGDLDDPLLVGFTDSDYKAACDDSSSGSWDLTEEACKYFKYKSGEAPNEQGHPIGARLSGLSLVDFNNDGFVDIAATYDKGYLRFFANTIPDNDSQRNKYVAFKLVGNPFTKTNKYAVGSSLVLTAVDKDGNFQKQLREVNSCQHHSDNTAGKDDRIIFGLGSSMTPVSLVVRWPNRDVNQRLGIHERSGTNPGQSRAYDQRDTGFCVEYEYSWPDFSFDVSRTVVLPLILVPVLVRGNLLISKGFGRSHERRRRWGHIRR